MSLMTPPEQPEALDPEVEFVYYFSLIQRRAHDHATKSGFWEGPDNNNLPTKLLLMISEIVEGFEEWRSNKDYHYILEGKPEGLGVELADTIIRLMDFAEHYDIPLADLVLVKMKYNPTRPHKHGGKRV